MPLSLNIRWKLNLLSWTFQIVFSAQFAKPETCCYLVTYQSQPLYHPESNQSGDARPCCYRCQHGKNRGDPETDPKYAGPTKPLTQPPAWDLHSSVAVIERAKNSAL